MDISDPIAPKQVGYSASSSSWCNCGTSDVVKNGRYLYKIHYYNVAAELRVYDTLNMATQPALSPIYTLPLTFRWQCCSIPNFPLLMVSSNRLLWVGASLNFFDVTNPAAPVLLPQNEFNYTAAPYQATDWIASFNGTTLYVLTYRSLDAVDLSNVNAPQYLGGYLNPNSQQMYYNSTTQKLIVSSTVYTATYYDYTPSLALYPVEMNTTIRKADANYIIAANTTELAAYVRSGNTLKRAMAKLWVKDLVIMNSAVVVAGGPEGVTKLDMGTTAFNTGKLTVLKNMPSQTVFDDPQGIDTDGVTVLVACGTDGVRAYNYATMALIRNLQVPGETVYQIRFSKNTEYAVAVLGTYLVILSVGTPSSMSIVSRISVSGKVLRVEGNFAYVENGNTITAVAVDNPFKPYPVRTFSVSTGYPYCIGGTVLHRTSKDGIAKISLEDLGNLYTVNPTQFGYVQALTPAVLAVECFAERVLVQWLNGSVSEHSTSVLLGYQPPPASIPNPQTVVQPPAPTAPPACYVPKPYHTVVAEPRIVKLNYVYTASCIPLLDYKTSTLKALHPTKNYGVYLDRYGGVLYVVRTDTPTPLLLSQISLGYYLHRVTLKGDMAIVAGDYYTFYLIDVSNVLNPVLAGRSYNQGSCGSCGTSDFAVNGEYGYKIRIQNSYGYMYIYNKLNTLTIANPIINYVSGINIFWPLKNSNLPSTPLFFTSATRMQWMAVGFLYTYDVSSPLSPVLIKSTNYSTTPYLVDYYQEYSYVINGTTLYLSDSANVYIMDITNDAAPYFVGSFSHGSSLGTTSKPWIEGSTLQFGNGKIYTPDDYAYTVPTLRYPTLASNITALSQNGFFAFSLLTTSLVAYSRYGVSSLYSASLTTNVEGTATYGDFAFVAGGWDGTRKVQASASQIQSGTITTLYNVPPEGFFVDPQAIATNGSIVVTAAGSEGLKVYSSSTLALMGRMPLFGRYVSDIKISPVNSQVAIAIDGLKLYTISTAIPSALRLLGVVNVTGSKLHVGATMAYVQNATHMTAVSLDDLTAPYVTRGLPGFGLNVPVCVSGSVMYAPGRDSVTLIQLWDLGSVQIKAPTVFASITLRAVAAKTLLCSTGKVVVQENENTVTEHTTTSLLALQPPAGVIPVPPPAQIDPPDPVPPVCQQPRQYGYVAKTGSSIIRFAYIGSATCAANLSYKTNPLRVYNEAKKYGAYAMLKGYSVTFVRLDTPTPVTVSSVDIPYPIKRLSLIGDLVAVAGDYYSGWIIDASNILKPVMIARLQSESEWYATGTSDIVINGNYVYKVFTYSSGGYLYAYSGMSSASPTNFVVLTTQTATAVPYVTTNEQPQTALFMSSPNRLQWVANGTMHTYDISVPSTPKKICSTTWNTNPYLNSDSGLNQYAAVLNGTRLFISSGGHIDVLDMRNDSSPRFIGSTNVTGNLATKVAVDGSTVILGNGAVFVVNEEDYTVPLGLYPFVPSILLDASTNLILTKSTTHLQGHIRNGQGGLTTGITPMTLSDLVLKDSYVYTANNANGIKKVYARTTDVTSGTLPVAISKPKVSTYDDPQGIDTDGNIVMTAAGSEGVRIFRASDLVLLGSYTVSGRYIYAARLLSSSVGVAVFGDQLITLDISNPASIKLLGSITVSGRKLQIGSRYAYVTTTSSDAIMSVISLNNPASPWLVRTIDRMSKACINGTLLYRVIPNGIATVVAHDMTDIETEEPRQFDSIPVNTPEITIVKCAYWTSTAQDMVVQWFDGTLSDHNVKPVMQKQYDVVRFVQTSTKVFEFHNRRVKRSDAQAFCASRSIEGFWGRLASVRSAEENAAIKSFNSETSSTKNYWLSLNDDAANCKWMWSDGDPYLVNAAATCTNCGSGFYCNFYSGSNNNQGALNYWYMASDGTWIDTAADALFHPICEYVKPVCAGSASYDGIRYTYAPLTRGSKVCRNSSGVCDVAETCDGTVLTCPTDYKQPTGTVCRTSAGICDAAEVCDGATNNCPADALAPSTTVCRPSVGTCDEPEHCTGASSVCPADVMRPSTFQCRPSFGECDLPETCTGSSPTCPTDTKKSGTLCRVANGACDKAEYCDGSNFDCPTDTFQTGLLCRSSTDLCDAVEYCDGTSASCPADKLELPTKLCRPVAGVCDQAEYCNGVSKSCPADTFKTSTEPCRSAVDICDEAETCNGLTVSCPPDGFKPTTQVCRTSSGLCDAAEYCTGSGSACPSDSTLPAGTLCRGTAGICDLPEYCTGSSFACPGDLFSTTIICRNATDLCDAPEVCDGTKATCNADSMRPSSYVCRAPTDLCDVPEYCTGSSNACPTDAVAPSSTVCRASAGDCDVAEYCSGTVKTCGTNNFKSSSTVCRASAGLCDVIEYCTGSSATCPIDAFQSSATVCRTAAATCEQNTQCSGTNAACPTTYKSSSTVCRAAVGDCDVVEYCTGSASACPADAFKAVNTVCRAVAGTCDIAEVCSGSAATCPTDAFKSSSTVCLDATSTCSGSTCPGTSSACPACVPIPCTAANCNNHATSFSGNLVIGCTCVCASNYAGSTCNACAANYQGYPTCSAIPCTNATDCNSHALSVTGTLVSGCTCTCLTGYSGTTCNACAANYAGYPSCSWIACTTSANCNGHATSVTGNLVVGCTCACSATYTNPTCSACATNYENYPTCSAIQCTSAANCNNHAASVTGTLVSGCSCTCSTGYTGTTCNVCATNYSGYPTCAPIACTVAANCNNHAASVTGTLVSGCTCSCSTGYTGGSCSTCSTGYYDYPTCVEIPCSVYADCDNHATSVTGTMLSGCTCTCSTGYTGTSCAACATNYGGYPQCVPIACTNAADCSGHALYANGTRVSGCSCTCMVGYTGTACSACATNYSGYPTCNPIVCTNENNCASHAATVTGTLVSGCHCTCLTGYTGTWCNGCSPNYAGYPNCAAIPCTVVANCNNHASQVSGTLVIGCSCTCSTGYTGFACDVCASGYSGYPTCTPIPCTNETNCNSNAATVSGNLVIGCTCTCATGYTGSTCDSCSTNYGGYPECEEIACQNDDNCNGHATAVTGTLVSGCICTCSTGFTGASCNMCANNYENYPTCSEVNCTTEDNCNGHADAASGTLVSGCTCTCSTGFSGASCELCADKYENYPTCSKIQCTVPANCNGHADAVSGTLVSGCTCTCSTGFTGSSCGSCAEKYENYPTCSEIQCTVPANCNGHADAASGTLVSGCTCTCSTGFNGSSCRSCADKYENYPTCSEIKCTVPANCNGHAGAVSGTLVSGCTCTCSTGFTGASCELCADKYRGYPQCTEIPCENTDCNNHANAVSGTLVSGCTCTCSIGFTGTSCGSCADKYENYPTCSEINCTVPANCNGHADGVSGTLVGGCACTCSTGFTGSSCGSCADKYENYPTCSEINCTVPANCNGHADAVSGTLVSGCTCTCSTGFTGASCKLCADKYENYPTCSEIQCTVPSNCNGHADAVSGTLVSGCTCTCSTGFTGASCEQCADKYENYPTCSEIKCTVPANCNGHADAVSGTLVSGCTCTCSTGYAGAFCNVCADKYSGFPICEEINCTISANCAGHATAVSGTLVSGCSCTCATGFTGSSCTACAPLYRDYPVCSEIPCTLEADCSNHADLVSGTLVRGCTCTCSLGFVGDQCNSCAENYELYPACSAIPCTNQANCDNHADLVSGTLVTGCTCNCSAGYTGDRCNGCSPRYEGYPNCLEVPCKNEANCEGHAKEVNGTLVSGCTCTCNTGFTGLACDACANNYELYPLCTEIPCKKTENCNNHADNVFGTLVSGCTCTCSTGFTGASCGSCADKYEKYPTCSEIDCTVPANCNGHADAVSGTLVSGCTCTCSTGFTGASCELCADKYENYPTCSEINCTVPANCNGHADAVSGTLVSGCTCACSTGFSGASCELCADKYENYPTCSEIQCTVPANCNGHADAVSGTLVSGCTCTCSTGFDGTSCGSCANKYENYPTCSEIQCTVPANCNGHADAVSGTLVSGCTCTCSTGFTGVSCELCADKYENYPTCSEIQCTVPANCNGHADAVSGTLVSGCTCTCSTGFTGSSCGSCADKYESYPTCSEIECTIFADCSNHATLVSGTLVRGCSCTCSTGFTGASCELCADKYENYPTCSEINCTVPANCNGHADAVSGTLVSGCTCTCSTGFTGASCELCADKYENYPTCSEIQCTVAANCNGHADAVSGTLVSGCTCICSTGFTGASCELCADKYENYPTCSEIKCTVPANCNGHADAASGTLVGGCTCTCSTGFTGASCELCADKYENYPTCSEIKCTISHDCNDHATSVSGTLVTGCVCKCVTGYDGWMCGQCERNYENYPNCTAACLPTGCGWFPNFQCIGGCCNVTGKCRIDTCSGNLFGSTTMTCPMLNGHEGGGVLPLRIPSMQLLAATPSPYPVYGWCTNGVCPYGSCWISNLGYTYTTCNHNHCSESSCALFNPSCTDNCLGVVSGGSLAGRLCVVDNTHHTDNYDVCTQFATTVAPTTTTTTLAPTTTTTTLAPTTTTTTTTRAPTTIAPASTSVVPSSTNATKYPIYGWCWNDGTCFSSSCIANGLGTGVCCTGHRCSPSHCVPFNPSCRSKCLGITADGALAGHLCLTDGSSNNFKVCAMTAVPPTPRPTPPPHPTYDSRCTKAYCVRIAPKGKCHTNCLGVVQCFGPACQSIINKTCIRHEGTGLFSICEGLPPKPTRPITTMPTTRPPTEDNTVPNSTPTDMTTDTDATTADPTTADPTTTKPTTAKPTTAKPTTAKPTSINHHHHHCHLSFGHLIEEMMRMRAALMNVFARLFRCDIGRIVVCRFYAGSTIAEFNVTSELTGEEAAAAVAEEMSNPESELVSTFGAIAGSFDDVAVAVATVDEITESPTSGPVVPTEVVASVDSGKSTNGRTQVLIPVAAGVAIVCVGGVAIGVFLVRRARKAAGNATAIAAAPQSEPAPCAQKYVQDETADVEVMEPESAPLTPQPTPQVTPQVRAFEYTQTWKQMNEVRLDDMQIDEVTPALTPMEGPLNPPATIDVSAHPCKVPDA